MILRRDCRVVFVQDRSTSSLIKLIKLSDDFLGKRNVLTMDQRNPTTKLFF